MKKRINQLITPWQAPRNIILAAIAIMLCPPIAHSANLIWTGAGDGISWNDPSNWIVDNGSPGSVPTNVDPTFIGRATNGGLQEANVVIGAGVSATTAALTIGHEAVTSSGTLTIEGNGSLTTNNTMLVGNYGQGVLILKDTATLIHNTSNLGAGIRPNTTGIINITGSARLTMNAGLYVAGERPDTTSQVIIDDHGIFEMTHSNVFYITYAGTHSGARTSTVEVKDHGLLSVASGTIRFGNTATATGTLTLRGNDTNGRGTALTRAVFGSTSKGYLLFDGGILRASGSANADFITGILNINTIGEGAFIDSNGRDIAITGTVSISGAGGITKLGAGALTLNNATAGSTTYTGSTVINAGALILTAQNQLAASSAITVAASSTLTAINLNQTLNQFSGAGVVNLGTGAATINTTTAAVFSGQLTASDLIITTPGSFTLSGNNTVSGNTTFSGALLTLGHANAIGTGEGKNLTITSGSLASTAASLALAHTITLQSGLQLAFDTGAGNVALSGAITGNSGINKTGAGNLTLSGDLSGLSGGINVGGGGLFIGDYNCAGNVTVSAFGAFGASGLITGNLTFAGSGALQVGLTHNDATVTNSSTLTITGALSFGGAATLRHDMYASGHDTIVAGSATFGSATNTIDLVNILSGTFTLIKLTSGTFSDSLVAPGAIITTQDGGATLSGRSTVAYGLNSAKNELLLISEKINHVVSWTGTTDSKWDSSTINWGGGDTKFVSGDKVIFGASGSQAIDIMPVGVIASEMSITGNGSYTFTGGRLVVDKDSLGTTGSSFGASPPTGIFTINTTGTVTLANNETNTFVGGIAVQQGTLIGNVMTLGDASITNNGRTIIDQATDDTFAGAMTGSGIFGKTGAGTLAVDGDFTGFTGKTEIEEGALVIADGVTYGSSHIAGTGAGIALYIGDGAIATGSITINNGTLFMVHDTSEVAGNVSIGASANIVGVGRIRGDVTMAPGSAITVDASGATDNAAILQMGNLALGTDASINGSGTLASTGISLGGNITLQEHYYSAPAPDFTIDGPIAGAGGITKVGQGTVVLSTSTSSSYSGPTNVLQGTLAAGSDNAFSPNSAHTIGAGANLALNGYSLAVGTLTNHGALWLGENGVTGGRLRINGAYTAAPGSDVHLSIVTADNTKTLSGQLSFANAANISGTTTIRAILTDHRSNKTLIIHDMEPLVIADTGEFAPGSFVLDDGQGFNRAILHGIDYVLEYDGGTIELIATTAAELPAALAANVMGNIVGRAAFGSLSQRLDYLHAANALPGSETTGFQVWGQTYYRADKLDGDLFPNSDGTAWGFQAGIDKRGDKVGNAFTTYGGFIDRTDASANLPNKTSADLIATGIGGYISAHTVKNWQIDAALRYSWDSHKVTVGRRHMSADGYTWGAMLRVAKINDLGRNWALTPQAQLIYQNRKINNMNDASGRDYAFGPENMSINRPSSLEGRVGAGLRKVIIVNDRISLAPYVSAHFLYEFRGSIAAVTVNNTSVSEDFGGDSYLFTLGVPVRLSKRIDVYADGSMQTGGPITGYGLNLGINYRW